MSYFWDSPPLPPQPLPESFSDIKEELLDALCSLSEEGSFAYTESSPTAPNPGIEVQELGLIGFPLSSRDATALKEKCRLSPFGKGEETLTDPSVRCSYELDSSEFQITNPAWDMFVWDITTKAYDKLGLSYGRANVKAELYKLLIYEKGAFFKSHQDSEKTTGMFGTLVISLPSKHEGGKVVLQHNDIQEVFDSAKSSPFETSFAAWYSDVSHEVQKVQSGYRIVLTYNLVQTSTSPCQAPPDGEGKSRMIAALEDFTSAITEEIVDNTEHFPSYMIYKLTHLYSESNLNLSSLKGWDSMAAQYLVDACRHAFYDFYLATLEKEVMFDHSMPDCEYHRRLKFTCIIDEDGEKVLVEPDYKDGYCLEEDETAEEDNHYAGSEHDEYTGNEGAMSTFKYKTTVLLMVPPPRSLEFSMSHSGKLADALGMFEDLRPKALEDEEAEFELDDICQIVIRAAKPENYWHDRESVKAQERQSCMDQVVQASLEHGWLHYIDRILYEQSHKPEHLQGYADYVSKNEVTIRDDSLWKRSGVTLSAKYTILGDITLAFNETTPPPTETHSSTFRKWYHEALHYILTSKLKADGGDGPALANVVETCGVDVHAWISDFLKGTSASTKAYFVLALKDPGSTQPGIDQHQKTALAEFWSDFTFWQDLRHDNLCELLKFTLVLGVLPVQRTLEQICAALPALRKWAKNGQMWVAGPNVGKPYYHHEDDSVTDYLAQVVIPFVGSVINHQVPNLVVEEDATLFESIAPFVLTVLCLYITRSVGEEPHPPGDWTKPANSWRYCGCSVCKKFGEFMESKERQVLRLAVTEKQKEHLEKYRTPYLLEILITTLRYMLVNRLRRRSAGNLRREQTRCLITRIGGKDMVYLKAYLGEHFDAVMGCRVEDLPKCEGLEDPSPPAKPTQPQWAGPEPMDPTTDAAMRMQEFMETRFEY
ncbi:hypothetical protein OHC33_007009 [Knufia fluminis]|uniref:Prolyl 4-hydroxylase alpha subunit Fe(2+) 2OG dioxygenase domain-containing protein n=1 Tax=Knufia fluminis TaxID=191047 RepID=A0AAN8EJ92_9EURO|nr:hypothetical protein OHC33_007009 [Knufia fluminis]